MALTRFRRLSLLFLLLLAPLACGNDPVEPDPTVQDFVGNWSASAMIFTSVADPSLSVDIVGIGASFFLDVQPSGAYTSSLSFENATATEFGHLEIDGERMIFSVEQAPTGPRVDTATYVLDGNRLEISGRTVFDFDLNGIGEAARLDGTLSR